MEIPAVSIVGRHPHGPRETVRKTELQAVAIVVTDDGPFSCDLFWLLVGPTDGCTLPGGVEGVEGLPSGLQTLPAFDNLAVIAAIGAVDQGRSLRRPAPGAMPMARPPGLA